MMENAGSNTYRLSCKVVEVISTGTKSSIRMISNPGSIIVDIPYSNNFKLGDRVIVTGNLNIIATEKDCSSEANHVSII